MFILKVDHTFDSVTRPDGFFKKLGSKGRVETTPYLSDAKTYKSETVATKRANELSLRYRCMRSRMNNGYSIESYSFYVVPVQQLASINGVYNLVNNIVTTETPYNSRYDVYLTVSTLVLLSMLVTIVWRWSWFKTNIDLLDSQDK